MKILELSLQNFRNYTKTQIELSPNLNVFVGSNAQGKTNLLESIYLCAIGKSPRTTKDKDLILWENKFAKVSIKLKKNVGTHTIDMYLFSDQNKAIKIDDVGIKKIGSLFGVLNAIYFSPDELKLIKESPDERRKFMDVDLCQFDKNYFYALSKYNSILAQRNKLLKTPDTNTLKDTIAIWDEQLSLYGAKIIVSRLRLIDDLKVFANSIHKTLSSDKEDLKISYQCLCTGTESEIKDELLKKLTENFDKDVRLGFTTIGPHRDDIKIEANGIDLRSFGSQGQQRTASLSLKLAELETFKSRIGEYPVLLLDDVLSELDNSRQQKLLEYVSNLQTLLTCTDFNFDIPAKKFDVCGGKIKTI